MSRNDTHRAWVYMLECSDGTLYTGHTVNLKARLARHNAGWASRYTRARRPVTLVYAKEYSSKKEAFRREREIKGWHRAKKDALVRGEFDALVELAKSYE